MLALKDPTRAGIADDNPAPTAANETPAFASAPGSTTIGAMCASRYDHVILLVAVACPVPMRPGMRDCAFPPSWSASPTPWSSDFS